MGNWGCIIYKKSIFPEDLICQNVDILKISGINNLQSGICDEYSKISYLLLQIYLSSKNPSPIENLSNSIINCKILIIESRKNIIIMNQKINLIQGNEYAINDILNKLDVESMELEAILTHN